MRLLPALLILLIGSGTAAAQSGGPEVHILVDVSGSMQRTDPDNLRRPAIRLAADLLPEAGRAGIWAFGGEVRTLTAPAPVDDDWRAAARASSGDIHASDQYTDIGAALEAATADWLADDHGSERPRHVILFTDGRVDITGEGDAEEDRRERRRILEELAPQLRDHGVHVHTVGLSEDIDHELMQALARNTGGHMTATRDADELERVFLRLITQVAPRDSVPLEGNLFRVDDSVSELTVVAFREADGEPVRLRTPGGTILSRERAEGGVRWRSEANHDLITVDAPASGEWELLGAEDPDNRVMVVTDLQLEMDALPAYAIAGEPIAVRARLTESGDPIRRDEFLELTRFTLTTDDGAEHSLRRERGEANFATSFTPAAGDRQLTLQVTADTFERITRHRMEVLDTPLELERSALPEQPELDRRLRFRPASSAVDPGELAVELTVQTQASEQLLRFPEAGADGTWDVLLDTLDPHKDFTVRATAVGTMPDGRDFRATIARFELPGLARETASGASPSWLLLGSMLVVFNLILFSVVGLAFYLFQQRRTTPPSLSNEEEEQHTGDTETP
ncbi:vWA domain-containing protein [Aquisalimonas lutea]|uniref:vWA domain-containing protein n=1 Tax=Aquisalimonas lutea TaxID=1327750 RepID=UPI0025B508DF|nr:vWA domain-containing protein [Aquisalimonas lutea]MDN3518425.1 vWA domain-containing protein [Aquisalimonas lutea]